MLYIDHIALHVYLHFDRGDPRNSKQLKDLRRELGILPFSYLSSPEYRYEDSVILIIFLS